MDAKEQETQTTEKVETPDGGAREESTTVEREVTESTPSAPPATGDRESLVPSTENDGA